MDGWALGKSKVFLKYYHVEVLSRIYEEQVSFYSIFCFNNTKSKFEYIQTVLLYAFVKQ